jgi:NADH dehydrogenase
MIAVAGGTGRLGTRVVTLLHARGLEVRVLTRDPDRASHLAGVATEVVTCDVRDRPETEQALQGTSAVVSAIHGFAGPGRVSPATVDRAGNVNLIDAAAAIDADVVLVSTVGASSTNPMELFRAKHAAEQHLQRNSRRWTIVRATAFVELWAEIMKKPIVFGRGDNPINFVSVADVAGAVEQAVVDPRLRGRVIQVGGPQNLTFNQLADLLQQTRGESAKVRHVPRQLLKLMSPLSRQARAAVAMDTIDMTFDAATETSANPAPTELPAALARMGRRAHASPTSMHGAL